MYLLKDRNNNTFSHGDEIVVFLNLNDAAFLQSCIKEEMRIENINYLPAHSVICQLKELIKHE